MGTRAARRSPAAAPSRGLVVDADAGEKLEAKGTASMLPFTPRWEASYGLRPEEVRDEPGPAEA